MYTVYELSSVRINKKGTYGTIAKRTVVEASDSKEAIELTGSHGESWTVVAYPSSNDPLKKLKTGKYLKLPNDHGKIYETYDYGDYMPGLSDVDGMRWG